MQGRTIRTAEKGEKLLAKLSQGFSVSSACVAEKISRTAFYEWKRSDEAFAALVDDAIESGTDRLEDVALKRAVAPKDASDTLLIFLLKGRRPDKFRERASVEHTGKDGEPLTLIINRPGDTA